MSTGATGKELDSRSATLDGDYHPKKLNPDFSAELQDLQTEVAELRSQVHELQRSHQSAKSQQEEHTRTSPEGLSSLGLQIADFSVGGSWILLP